MHQSQSAGARASGFEHPLCGCDPLTLFAALRRNGFVDRAHVPSLAAIVTAVAFRLPFSLAEAGWFAWRRRSLPPVPAPVFIIGHWRSGTTHLHNVMSCDRQFGTIPPLAAGLPWDIFGLVAVLRPLLLKALPERRYIDNIPVTADSPQEDEFALANMTPVSFYHGLYFPTRLRESFERGLFLAGCTEREVAQWRRRFAYFLAKVSLAQGGRRLLLKNPVYSTRVALLREIWPDARFIHVHRDPAAVFASRVKSYRVLLDRFALQSFDQVDVERVVLDLYPRIMQALIDQTAALPPGAFAELAFEAFERDPMAELERVYGTLALPGFAAAAPAFRQYLAGIRGYAKNRHAMDETTRRKVERAWAPFVARWGAAPGDAPAVPAE